MAVNTPDRHLRPTTSRCISPRTPWPRAGFPLSDVSLMLCCSCCVVVVALTARQTDSRTPDRPFTPCAMDAINACSVITNLVSKHLYALVCYKGGSVAEWLACWTQVHVAVATLSGNSLRQTVHTHCAPVHQAAKLVAALLRVAGVTAGLAESNSSLPPGLWLTSPAGWLPRTGISSGTLRSVIEPPFCKPNLFLFIQPRWQLRTYFFNHYNVLF